MSNHAHQHSTRHRQVLTYKIYIYTYSCRGKPSPIRELSTPPSSAFLLLPAVRIPSCFSKVSDVERIRLRRRMIKPRRNRWVGTGTSFCTRPEKAPRLQEHHTVTEGRTSPREDEESRNDTRRRDKPIRTSTYLKDWHGFRLRKEFPSQEIDCHSSSSEFISATESSNLMVNALGTTKSGCAVGHGVDAFVRRDRSINHPQNLIRSWQSMAYLCMITRCRCG